MTRVLVGSGWKKNAVRSKCWLGNGDEDERRARNSCWAWVDRPRMNSGHMRSSLCLLPPPGRTLHPSSRWMLLLPTWTRNFSGVTKKSQANHLPRKGRFSEKRGSTAHFHQTLISHIPLRTENPENDSTIFHVAFQIANDAKFFLCSSDPKSGRERLS